MEGCIAKGTIKRLRVVALEYPAAGVSKNLNRGPAGDSHINTPISIENGSQDVKHILGEVDIERDGRACLAKEQVLACVGGATHTRLHGDDDGDRLIGGTGRFSELRPG